jgi:hypothetical protein
MTTRYELITLIQQFAHANQTANSNQCTSNIVACGDSALQGKYMSKRVGKTPSSSDTDEGKRARRCRSHKDSDESASPDHLRKLVEDAYHELDDLYSWLRRNGVSKYGLAGSHDKLKKTAVCLSPAKIK